jgi:hypothetical protein
MSHSPPKSRARTEGPPSQDANGDSGSSDDEDEALALLEEQRRLAQLREKKKEKAADVADGGQQAPIAQPSGGAKPSTSAPSAPAPPSAAAPASASSYNADVLFRRHPAAPPKAKPSTPAVDNNLLASKAHATFMKAFFK